MLQLAASANDLFTIEIPAADTGFRGGARMVGVAGGGVGSASGPIRKAGGGGGGGGAVGLCPIRKAGGGCCECPPSPPTPPPPPPPPPPLDPPLDTVLALEQS